MAESIEYTYYKEKGSKWYFEGVQPYRDKFKPLKRLKIENDVWLGQNVMREV